MTVSATTSLVIETVTVHTPQIVSVGLVPADGGLLPDWQPGAHLEIHLPSGLIRHYSLAGDPLDRSRYEIAVLREDAGRGGSREFHALAEVGAELRVGAPKNKFALVPAQSYLFLAGGIGLTPILAMIRAAEARGADWRLVYGGRSRSTMAYLDTLSGFDPSRVEIFAEDERGRPDFAAEISRLGAETPVYACGPGPMLDALTSLYESRAFAPPLHFERFVADGEVVDIEGAPFEVVLKRSKVSVQVGPTQTILGAIRAVMPTAPFSCEEGYCGTCETAVLDGTPDHRDTYLTEEERDDGDAIMICVSRCLGPRLVLDL